jgi:hypothetical protein
MGSRAKSALEKRRRERVQRKRLAALGMPQTDVDKLNAKAVREALKRPQAIRKRFAASA